MTIVDLFKARSNPADRFERIIGPCIDTLYRFAFRLCHSRDDAEELVQLLLTRLFPKIDQLESIEKLSPWLCRSLYNLYIDHYRSAVRNSTLFDQEADSEKATGEGDSPFDHVSGIELKSRIDAALQQLNDDQRVVVLLHDSEGYTLNQLAEILQVPLGTLKSRLNRARIALKKSLLMEPLDDSYRDQGTKRKTL